MIKKIILPTFLFSLIIISIFFFRHKASAASKVTPAFFPLRNIDSTLSYTKGNYTLTVRLSSLGKFGYRLSAQTKHDDTITSNYAFTVNYPVYHFELGDVDRDGNVDICLGVIKKTHCDSTSKKRLFFYRLDQGRIRPLWLGSKVSHELVDFRYITEQNNKYIRTVEKEINGNYLVAEYEWKGFGLGLSHYISRNINLTSAYETFNKT